MGDDQSRRLLESNLLKILPPGEYVDPHWLQTMHSAGITYPDVNLIRALTENKTGRKNGAAEYLHLRKKLPRKGTQYDNELYSYPYQYKQLHADHADAGYGNHYDIEMPELDEVLLTDETTENVFRKNRHASDAAVKKCISDAFFAGEVKGWTLCFINLMIICCNDFISLFSSWRPSG